MNRHLLILIGLMSLTAAMLSGCQTSTLPSEPTGGNWRPILLDSTDAIRLPAPPEANSATQKDEIAELLEFQSQRTNSTEAKVEFWNTGASVRWNEIARNLVAKYRTEAPLASRVYALVSVAQYDATVAAWNNKYFYNRPAPSTQVSTLSPMVIITGDPVYPSDQATIAAASAAVLTYLYPTEAKFLEDQATEHETSRLIAGVNFRSDLTAGDDLGRQVAKIVIERAQADNSDAIWKGTIPTSEGSWFSAPDTDLGLPAWGQVKPWLMVSGDQFRSAPPPEYNSAEFKSALAEVKEFSDSRTPEQARTAALWADGAGSYTPPGRWNKIASDLIVASQQNEIRAARSFALLNMAMMDAGIACWNTKFHYWVLRPSQADPSITTPVGLPNFPSYTSGHAAFSGAGAEVLSYLFPAEQQTLQAKAEEAALSRIYGGIHYRFDSQAGLAQGRAIAQLAIARGRSDGAP